MHVERKCQPRPLGPRLAYTLVETVIAVAVIAIISAALFGGFFSGFSLIQTNRENGRATQILTEKMEMIRLFNWEQINDPNYLPGSFTNYFDPANTNNPGFAYVGTVTVAATPATGEKYLDHMRQVSIQLTWSSRGKKHQRDIRTFVSEYGLQKYIF